MVDLSIQVVRDDLARIEAILDRFSSPRTKRMSDAKFRAMCEREAAALRELLRSLSK
jgi:hypothetical protein